MFLETLLLILSLAPTNTGLTGFGVTGPSLSAQSSPALVPPKRLRSLVLVRCLAR
jgi:hypothetical protein